LPVHTQLLRFRPEREYVSTFWAGNPDVERCHIPWDWCVPVKHARRSNSILMFRPTNHTLHAVQARYDHTSFQPTHIYRNPWYDDGDSDALLSVSHKDLDARTRTRSLPQLRVPTRDQISRELRRRAAVVRDTLRGR